MADPVSIASTALTAFGAFQQYQAGQDASDLARQETAEQVRRTKAQDRARLAEARARAAASGVQMSGSTAQYINNLGDEQKRQLKWLRRSGGRRADTLGKQGTASAVGSLSRIPSYWE